MKLKYKISISMTIVSLVLLWFISYFYSDLSYKSVMDYEKKELEAIALESARDIKLELFSKLSNVKTISTTPIVLKSIRDSNLEYLQYNHNSMKEYLGGLNKRWMRAYDEEDTFVKPYLNNQLAQFLKKQQKIFNGVYGEIFVTNQYGAVVATTGKLTTFTHSHKYWWKESYSNGTGKIFFDDRGFDASVNGYVIGIVVPIKEDGKVIGILKANVNIMNTLSSIVGFYNKTKRLLKIVRTKGDIVYEQNLPPLSTTINPNILTNLQAFQVGSKIIRDYSQKILIAYAPIRISLDDKNIIFGGKSNTKGSIKGNDGEIWHTVVSYNKEFALQESRETNLAIIYIGLLLTLLSLSVAYYIGKWISKPIDELQLAQQKLQTQEEIMIAQSRHAAMGEMISMIAHQWRQPISAIAMGANNILADIELDMLNEKSLKKVSYDILNKTQELSKTIDDFKGFFKPQKVVDIVSITDIFSDAFNIIGKSLENSDIKLIIDFKDTKEIRTYSRELMQVLINILKNAKEALDDNNIEQKEITVSIDKIKDSIVIKICDNAGGIKNDIISKIYEPYFSTKNEKNGTGLGLYMCKTIIQKHLHGILKGYNLNNGACFEISLPFDIENSGDSDE